MNIGMTGHNGFLGRYVQEKLKQHPDIVLDGFDLPDKDIFNKQQLEGFVKGKDAIIHLAALNRADDSGLFHVNACGTQSLLLAVKEHNPDCRIIFASSFQVYGATEEKPITEDVPTITNNIYGLSKKTGEQLVRLYAPNHAILRISNIYGPGGKPFYNSVIATFAHLIKEEKPLTIHGDGTQTRDFIFVEDVASAIITAALGEDRGIYNVCTGEEVSLNGIIDTIKGLLGKEVDVNYEPSKNPEVKQKGSCEKFKSSFGWIPKYNFKKGMEKVL